MTDREAYVAFNLTDQVGSATVGRLVAEAGSAAAAWERYPKKVSRAGGEIDVAREFELAESFGVKILVCTDDGYPDELKSAPGHPLVLYVKGDPKALSKPSIALVGTRRATEYGLSMAYSFARDLAGDGWGIVSGLAVGIDAEAHRGALDAKGVTVGVLGSALDRFYPAENRSLARTIVASGGAVVSEFPFGRTADQHTFPQRNHVVAALARGVLAVEAPVKSGTLITASIAADLARLVMAVPGRVDSRSSQGCLALIRDGATLVRYALDVEQEMGQLFPRTRAPAEKGVKAPPPEMPGAYTVEEAMVMRHATVDGTSIDEIARKTGLPAAKTSSLCMVLRVKGRLRFLPGNRVALPRER